MVLEALMPKFVVHAASKKEEPKEEEPEEAEMVDPFQAAREHCEHDKHVSKMKSRLERCNDRVNSTPGTEETCVEEMMDFMHALDHCAVHHGVFEKLK